MGKRSRKTKAKKSDFQKVKLKVGKRKPLPNNVTEVAFKSQGIYIPEQLKNVDANEMPIDDEYGHRKHNVTELLGQVGHFNTNFRADALTALRVQLGNNQQLAATHLPKIIEKIPRTLVDQDQQVRKFSISFFRLLFSCLSEKQISPFFNVILSHLHCAMSHIYDDVQRDSLQMVDLCVEHYPNLITENDRSSLLQHFIEMISTKRSTSAASKTGSKSTASGSTRVLSMRLSSKESSISWRIRVLQRLFALLQTSEIRDASGKDSTLHLASFGKFNDGNMRYNAESGFIIPWNSDRIGELLTSYNAKKLRQSPVSLGSRGSDILSSINFENQSPSSPWKLITTLFPLLFDCWHEALADEKRALGSEAVSTMMHVLNIAILLCKRFIKTSDEKAKAILAIRSMYLSQFDQYFLASFPLDDASAGAGGRKQRHRRKYQKSFAPELRAGIQSVNLSICELVTLLALESELQKDAEILSSIAIYISSVVVAGNATERVDATTLKKIIATKRRLLDVAADKNTVESLLHPLVVCYDAVSGLSRTVILQFFLDLYSQEGGRSDVLQNNAVMVGWICSLPDLLISLFQRKSRAKSMQTDGDKQDDCPNAHTDPGSDCSMIKLVLSCMRLASLRQSTEYLNTMKSKTSAVLSSLHLSAECMFCHPTEPQYDGQASWCCRCSDLQAHIFEVMVFHSPGLSHNDMVILTRLCHHVTVSVENVYYVSEMLVQQMTQQCPTKKQQVDSILLTFKFLCSVLLGTTKEALQSCQTENRQVEAVPDAMHIPTGLCSESALAFERHRRIVSKLCQLLPTVDQAYMFLQPFLCEKVMKEYKVLPANSIFGVLHCGKMLLSMQDAKANAKDDLASSLGKLCAGCLFNCSSRSQPCKNMQIVRSIKKAISDLFKINVLVLKSCIELLTSAGTAKNACETICLVTQELLLDLALHREFLECREMVENIFSQMKVQCKGIEEEQWFKSATSNLSVMLRAEKT